MIKLIKVKWDDEWWVKDLDHKEELKKQAKEIRDWLILQVKYSVCKAVSLEGFEERFLK